MMLPSACLIFTLIAQKHHGDPPAVRNSQDTQPGMSGTGWLAACISEDPSCRPDYPAPRPPGSALRLRSKTGRVAEGLTSATQNRRQRVSHQGSNGKLIYLHACACVCVNSDQCMHHSQHSWGVKATHTSKKTKMWPARNTGCCTMVEGETKTGINQCTELQADLWPSSVAFHTPQRTFSRQWIMVLGVERSRENSNKLFTSSCLTLTTNSPWHAVPIIMVVFA